MTNNGNERSLKEIFEHNYVKLNASSMKLLWIVVFVVPVLGSIIVIPIVLVYRLDANITMSNFKFIISILVFAMGLTFFLLSLGIITGYSWRFWGRILTKVLFFERLKQIKQFSKRGGILGRIDKFFFGEKINRKFILLETPDVDHSTLTKLTKSTIKIWVMFAAMFVIFLNIELKLKLVNIDVQGLAKNINDLFPADRTNLITPIEFLILAMIAFAAALSILALYLPLLLITDDTCLLNRHDDGQITYSASDTRNFLNSIFGITTVFSGYNLVADLIELKGIFSVFGNILAFIVVMLLIVIYAIPILYPAIVIYYGNHSEIVNNTRRSFRKEGFPVARSRYVVISKEENAELE